MSYADHVEEYRHQRKLKSLYPILVGAIAVSADGTLISSQKAFMAAIEKIKCQAGDIPERFQSPLDEFNIFSRRGVKVSEEVESVFRKLHWLFDGVTWTHYWGSFRSDTRIGYIGDCYFMDFSAAQTFISKEQFTPEELDWLWELAQKMHLIKSRPVVRRSP